MMIKLKREQQVNEKGDERNKRDAHLDNKKNCNQSSLLFYLFLVCDN